MTCVITAYTIKIIDCNNDSKIPLRQVFSINKEHNSTRQTLVDQCIENITRDAPCPHLSAQAESHHHMVQLKIKYILTEAPGPLIGHISTNTIDFYDTAENTNNTVEKHFFDLKNQVSCLA
ncbi:MAG: hypothetical protein SP4CHLAM5_06640 [Chlamydiia bacterium]|nr:hypothetical protein [Chlamydiia bacterium]MCH9618532.1 hypothetical protein [Chlamydiia bacterium]MCH9624240.1 hypothetical protein [Chlamydiia bacterium]